MKRMFVGLLISSMFALSLAAGAETLSELPFAKKLKLAKVGDEEAQMAVASAYESGSEAKKDIAEAAKWYRQAALAGNIEAEFRLARLVSKGAKGLTKDLKTSAKLYEAAANSGHLESQNAMGLAYQNGLGVEVNEAKAVEWYKKAADGNLAAAQNNLGLLYLNGKGVERNVAEAFKLFELAAKQGDGWGLNNLGGMYEMGWGATKDRAKAASYYKQAVDKGIESAQANLARLSPGGAPVAPVTLN
jgi:TPR repeat protein